MNDDFVLTGVDLSPKAVEYRSLYQAVSRLPSSAKKAMYAAASARKIEQGTWDGCAFNQGGWEIGNQHITSHTAAAEAFHCSVKVVSAFISAWDSLEADDPTGVLRETLEEVGLFHEPTRAIRIIRTVEWKSEQTKLVDQFKAEMEDPNFTVEGLSEACDLLGV